MSLGQILVSSDGDVRTGNDNAKEETTVGIGTP